jgi:peroxiredoxin
MLKKSSIFFFSLFSVISVFSAETSITGLVPGGQGCEIRLITYSDQITYNKILLDRTLINSLGSFSLKADINEVIVSFLDMDYFSATLYLEPGQTYSIVCDSISLEGQYRPFYEKDYLDFRIILKEEIELNSLISGFNQSYNEFITENFENIYKRRKKYLIVEFRRQTEEIYKGIEIKYFWDYINYKLASAELSASSSAKAELFNKYLQKQPVLDQNVEYMLFFNSFFDHHLTMGNRFIKETDLISVINDQSSYTAMMDTLGKDTLLREEKIRELVLIKGLQEIYYSPDFKNEKVLRILSEVVALSPFREHRNIAATLSKSLTKLQKGTTAPDFRLADLKGDTIALSEFFGKPVYLSFLATWTNACLAEFKIMDSLFIKYGNSINFITVSLDNTVEVVIHFTKDKNYNWTFLYNGTSYNLIQDYGIKTFPLFVLIDRDGKILQYPAYKPSEGIGDTFERLLQKSKE